MQMATRIGDANDFEVNRCIFKVAEYKNMYFAFAPILEVWEHINCYRGDSFI